MIKNNYKQNNYNYLYHIDIVISNYNFIIIINYFNTLINQLLLFMDYGNTLYVVV